MDKIEKGADEDFRQIFEGIISETIQSVNNLPERDQVSEALICFLVRVRNTWRSIYILRENYRQVELELGDASFLIDAAALIRAMYDAYLQAAYICHNVDRQVELANLYFEYQHVEKYRLTEKALKHDTQVSNDLKASTKRLAGEKQLQSEYDRVKQLFTDQTKRGPKVRDKWYKGNLRDLAVAISNAGKHNVVAEYDFFVAQYNGAVHSSAFMLQRRPMISSEHTLTLTSKIVARVIKLNIDYNQLELSQLDSDVLDSLCSSLLGETGGQ